MIDNDKVYYKSEDYTVRFERTDGCERYFITFHGLEDSLEQEITIDVFTLYYKEFKKPLEKKRDEQRRTQRRHDRPDG